MTGGVAMVMDARDIEVGMTVRRVGDPGWTTVEEIGHTRWLRWLKFRGDGPTITAPSYAPIEIRLEDYEF